MADKQFGDLKNLENFTTTWNGDTYRKVFNQYSPKVKACERCNDLFAANCINNRTREPAHLCPNAKVFV